MQRRIVLVAGIGLLIAATGAACSSFTGESADVADGGSPDAPEVDTSIAADASTDRDAADAADASDAADGDGFPRTPLVHVTNGSVPYAIEATEVSVLQYSRFKQTFPVPLTFPSCPMKTTLGPPAGSCGARLANTDPMTCVDWCDADAYCRAIGRHLCGSMSGGSLSVAQRNDPGSDEWYFACRGPLAWSYPYGPAAMVSVCATNASAPSAVGMFSGCTGSEPGLFDMSGNAAEWVSSCVSGACLVRGGSYTFSAGDANCDADGLTRSTTDALVDIGFRCCAEP